jgi:hypothetical protein
MAIGQPKHQQRECERGEMHQKRLELWLYKWVHQQDNVPSYSFSVIREAISDPMRKSQQWLTQPICQILPLLTFQFQKIKRFTTGIHYNYMEYIKRHMTQHLNSSPQRKLPLGARHIFHMVQW